MPNAKDVSLLDTGLMIGLVSPPGFGKSTFIKSATEKGVELKTYVALSPARELTTYTGEPLITYDIYEDLEWQPKVGSKKAEGFINVLKHLYSLRTSDYKVIGVDTGNRILDMCGNFTLSKYGCGDMADLEGTKNGKYGFWADYKNYARQFVNVLSALRSAGKHVIVAWHQDVKEIEGMGAGAAKIASDGTKEIFWDEGKVPAVMGSIRDEIAGWFDIFAFMERDIIGADAKYWIRVKPTSNAWAKTAAPIFKEPRVPANFKTVLDAAAAYALAQKKLVTV